MITDMKDRRSTDWELFLIGLVATLTGGVSLASPNLVAQIAGAGFLWAGGCLQAWAAPTEVFEWMRTDQPQKA